MRSEHSVELNTVIPFPSAISLVSVQIEGAIVRNFVVLSNLFRDYTEQVSIAVMLLAIVLEMSGPNFS
jgi:hypothetical protein